MLINKKFSLLTTYSKNKNYNKHSTADLFYIKHRSRCQQCVRKDRFI